MAETRPRAGSLKQVPLDKLVPFPGNARRGDVDAIANSLQVHGQYKPIVVNARDMKVLAGNHTVQAAEQLGLRKLKVFFVDVDDDQALQINLIDNRTNDLAAYDTEALVAQLQALPDLELAGYDESALQTLLSEIDDEPDGGEADPDDVPEIAPSRVDPGDLWQMGEHFLVCGDATDGDVLAKLMGREQAHMVWTDPPYNVDYEGKTDDQLKIANDALPDSEFFTMILAAFERALAATVEGGPIYACHPDTGRLLFELAMRKAGWYYAQTLVWVKDVFALSRQDYEWQHEPILYGWRPGKAHRWFGQFDKSTVVDDEVDPKKLDKRELVELVRELRNQRNTDVVREPKPTASEEHPIMKPVELVQRHLQNSSTRGDIVLDPFAGSGTTAIAAETLSRKARLVELDPGYADVILVRWERFTGRKAKLRRSAR